MNTPITLKLNTANPTEGCELILKLLKNLCGNDDEKFAFVLRWLAYPLQNPNAKMGTALVVNQLQESSTSIFFQFIMCMIHGKGHTTINQHILHAPFNTWASKKTFVFCEGLNHHFKDLDVLKNLISSTEIVIDRPLQEAQTEPNTMNFVFSYNGLLNTDSRRLITITPRKHLPQKFFHALRKQKDEGGIALFHRFLLSIDLTGFNEQSTFI